MSTASRLAPNSNMTLHPLVLGTTSRMDRQIAVCGSIPECDGYDFRSYSRALERRDRRPRPAGNRAQATWWIISTKPGGATAIDSSGNHRDGTIISMPQLPPAMSAFQIILSPGGTGLGDPDGQHVDWDLRGGERDDHRLGLERQHRRVGEQPWRVCDVQQPGRRRTSHRLVHGYILPGQRSTRRGLSLGSSTAAIPMRPMSGTDRHLRFRVDGANPRQVFLPVGYGWPIWNHADTMMHLTPAHTRSAC